MTRIIVLNLAFLLLFSGRNASAQSGREIIDMFGGMLRSVIQQQVIAEWRKLPPDEVTCIDENLRQKGQSLETLFQQGVYPSDPALFVIRAQCRTARADTPP